VKYAVEQESAEGAWREVGWFSRATDEAAEQEFDRGVGPRTGRFRLVDETGRVVTARNGDMKGDRQ
jgi:hypothetical protein